SLSVAHQSSNRLCEARSTENLGIIAQSQGNYREAGTNFERAAVVFRELNMSADTAQVQSNLGSLRWIMGDPAAARPLLESARDLLMKLGLANECPFTLATLGDVQVAQDDLPGAQKSYEQALKLQTGMGQDLDAAVTQMSLATLWI